MTRKITVTKIDAARRHLRLAIELWFNDGDPAPTHTLARAAYQVVHDLNFRNKGPELLFDSSVVKAEFRGPMRKILTEASDFMKHGDRGKAGMMNEVTLDTELTRIFIMFSCVGLKHLGQELGPEEIAFNFWQGFHKSELLTDLGKQLFETGFDAQVTAQLKALSKPEFFNRVVDVLRNPPVRFGVTRESFMPRRFAAWIEPDDFETLRQSAVDHLDLPDTYDEWLKLATEEEAKFGAVGIVFDKVVVHPDEFAAYCLASGLKQNAVTFGAFAVAKASKQNKG